MATQLWNKEITKSVDWGGDTSTGGAPVSGQFVQKFIKDQLAKKFGYLNYDKSNNKYQVFADEEDYQTWKADPNVNANLLLATFDAPAPATIVATLIGDPSVTILSSEKDQQLRFNYYIEDSNDKLMTERVNLRMTVSNGGITQTYTTSYEPDYDNYDKRDENDKPIGVTQSIAIDNFLNLGTNNITITLTGATTQAQYTLNCRYTVVELRLESGFDNTVAQVYDVTKPADQLYDVLTGNVINIDYTCSGQGTKFIEISVNGQPLKQNNLPAIDPVSSGDVLTGNEEYTSSLLLFLSNEDGTLREPFHDGVNQIRARVYIKNGLVNIYSNTLYYDVVVRNKASEEDEVYILYKQSLMSQDDKFLTENASDTIEFSTKQYLSASFEYSVYSSSGKQVPLLFTLTKKGNKETNEPDTKVAELERSLNSGDSDVFKYTFMTFGRIEINIQTQFRNSAGELVNSPKANKLIYVDVEKVSEQINVLKGQDLLLNLEALNRSNSEPEEKRNQWIDPLHKGVVPVFKNVYFNDASGWDGEALLLNNGAQVEIPYNMFGADQNKLNRKGWTFEITFEMVNVQNEEAKMVSFRSDDIETNPSYFELTASGATIMDKSKNLVDTRFNANNKIKLAFIVNPVEEGFVANDLGQKTANDTFIIVNGILDRATMYSGNIIWTGNSVDNAKLVIGNPDGLAGIRVFSVRVYDKALSLDEELTNWIAESDDIIGNYEKNKIYEDGKQDPDITKLNTKIPTLVLYGDVDATQPWNSTGKKFNLQMDMLFVDPDDHDRDFYARGCWISPQGTSSMSYPIKNLRPYFCKTRDDLTQEKDAKFYTEVYLAGEFNPDNVFDEQQLHHFYTNKKTTVYKHTVKIDNSTKEITEYYHKCYNIEQAKKLELEGEQIFYLTYDEQNNKLFMPCSLGQNPLNDYKDNVDLRDYPKETTEFYVYGVREVKPFKSEGISEEDDDYKSRLEKFLKELRLSGQTLYVVDKQNYSITNYKASGKPEGIEYPVTLFKKVKGKDKIDTKKTYYLIQGVWKQYEHSGWTDRWTLKADYAESSMCNNAGTGRLWGNALKYFSLDDSYPGMTNAQDVMNKKGNNMVDIRTSCDGKPIVCFKARPKRVGDIVDSKTGVVTSLEGAAFVYEDGKRQYYTPIYAGLYNIMTDKSSTPLFGFEDIYSPEGGDPIFTATSVECWECTSNAMDFPQGLTVSCDTESGVQEHMDARKPWKDSYEPRWPDCKGTSEKKDPAAHTHHLESFWRFINFCKDAVVYKIGEVDGYNFNTWHKVKDIDMLNELYAKNAVFGIGEIISGNFNCERTKLTDIKDLAAEVDKGMLYYFDDEMKYDQISKTVSTTLIKDIQGLGCENGIYKAKVPSYDALYGKLLADIPMDAKLMDKNGYPNKQPIKDIAEVENYYIDVYLEQRGNKYYYKDTFGVEQTTNVDKSEYEKDANGQNYNNKTLMQYFSDKKGDYLDLYKVAAYYIYIMRFAGVDQVVKNTMMTTEDGQHYYFINYDNDTIFGVRNDGVLIYHWGIDRTTFDPNISAFCFAGNKSVLWNLLECDEHFMSIVKRVDNAMFAQGLLSRKEALIMYNDKQEGVWGERLYNINEQRKYLSQLRDGSYDKFLGFIHGSSNQYRSWFVTNRFNYYDSLWETGDYASTKTTIYLDIADASPETTFMEITAARQNKFKLLNTDATMKDEPSWKIELGKDETGEWKAIKRVTGASSPFNLLGCDKIKVLNFRPTVAIPILNLQKVQFRDNVTWQEDKGCLMTSFLIGTSDEYLESSVHRYTNTKNEKAVLSTRKLYDAYPVHITPSKINLTDAELDASNIIMTQNEATGNYEYSLKPGTAEANLPIIVLNPGEHYDLSNTTEPVDSDIVYEFVPSTVCGVAQISGINSLYSLEEIDIRNCYNSDPKAQLNDMDISNLRNLHTFRAIGSSITTFKPAKGCSLYEVSLPQNRIEEIALDNVTFVQTKDEQGKDIPQWKYTPDFALRSLSLKNVTMDKKSAFDIKEFINTWIDGYINTYGELDENGDSKLKNLTLSLDGVDFSRREQFVTFDWLVKLYKLNIKSLTGDIYVLGDEKENGLTQEQFDALNKMFDRPFETTSSLRLKTDDAVFWSFEGGTKITLDEEQQWGVTSGGVRVRVSEYYEILHEDVFKFRATVFSSNDNLASQQYNFEYLNIPTSGDYSNSVWQNTAKPSGNILYVMNQQTGQKFKMTLKESGYSEFVSLLSTPHGTPYPIQFVGKNELRLIRIYKQGTSDYIYIKVKTVIEPSEIVLYDNDNLLTPVDGKYVVEYNEHLSEHRFRIEYKEGTKVTVDSIMPTVSFIENGDKHDSEYGLISNISTNADKKLGSVFTFTNFLQPEDCNDCNIYITAKFKTSLNTEGQKSLKTSINVQTKTIIPNRLLIVIPEEYERTYPGLIRTKEETIYKRVLENDEFVEVPYTRATKLSINCVIPEEGFDFPIKPVRVSGGVNEVITEPNVPIRSFDNNIIYQPETNKFIADPKPIQKDGKWYLHIEPTQQNRWTQSFDAEYNIFMSGEYGYTTTNKWITEATPAKNPKWGFELGWRLDASIIWPNDIDIIVNYGTDSAYSIKEKGLVINASNEVTTDFKLTFVPVDKNIVDPVTVPVSFKDIKFDLYTNFLSDDVVYEYKLAHLADNWDYENNRWSKEEPDFLGDLVKFVETTPTTPTSENPLRYPEVTLTYRKYFDTDFIIYLRPTITATFETEPVNNYVKSDTINIVFRLEQTISSANRIEDCVSYEINGYEDFPWYFVDSSNYYYKFNSSIIDQIIKNKKLNSLIGIAKRVQYGWGDKIVDDGVVKYKNDEEKGNPYNNACVVWDLDPNINVASLAQNKVPESFKHSYYRALCIPLANWYVNTNDASDTYSMLSNNSTDALIASHNSATVAVNDYWSKDAMGLNSTYGSWAIPRYPLCMVGSDIGVPTSLLSKIIRHFAGLESEQGLDIDRRQLSVHWLCAALHRPNANSVGGQYSLPNRNTDKYWENNNYTMNINTGTRRRSMYDIRTATKLLCTGELPIWVSTVGYDYTLQKENIIENLVKPNNPDEYNKELFAPGYGNGVAFVSGLVDTWHHFNIYRQAIVDTNVENNPVPSDIRKFRCYPASVYELECLFNGGKQSTGDNREYLAMKTDGNQSVPYGIYEIIDGLEKTGCLKEDEPNKYSGSLAVIENGTSYTHNIFIEQLYKYFVDKAYKQNINWGDSRLIGGTQAVFGSMYYMTGNDYTGDYGYNAIASYEENGKYVFKFTRDDTTVNETPTGDGTGVFGTTRPIITIPLIIVD